MRFLAILLMITSGIESAWASTQCQSYDLKSYWPEDSIRDQGDFGACHAFAATAVVEAKLYQRTGRHWALSARDAFEESFLKDLGGNQAIEAIRAGKLGPQGLQDPDPYFAEGAQTVDDLKWILKNGVALEESHPFDYAKNPKALLHRKVKALRDWRDFYRHQVSQQNDSGILNRVFMQIALYGSVRETLDRVVLDDLKRLMEARSAAAFQDRERVKVRLQGLRVRELQIPKRDLGAKARRVLLDALKREQVTAIAVGDYERLKKGEKKLSRDTDKHAVVVVGYDCATDEFLIRNSWGVQPGLSKDGGYERFAAERLLPLIASTATLEDGRPQDYSGF